ncbi:MAG: HdaA/DnaA family protein [Desulfomonilaceae bacterium]
MKQIALPLYDSNNRSFSDVVHHPGITKSIQMLQANLIQEANQFVPIFLHGPSGSGKTLILKALLTFLKSSSHANHPNFIFIPVRDSSDSAPRLESVVSISPDQLSMIRTVIIDDVDDVSRFDAKHLWNLWNQLLTTGARLITASSVGPEEIFADDQHLRSRMISGLTLGLAPPDDNTRVLILDKMARKKGLRLTHDVISYLLSRKSRNLKRLEQILEILDTVSMEEHRKVTLRFLKGIEASGLI